MATTGDGNLAGTHPEEPKQVACLERGLFDEETFVRLLKRDAGSYLNVTGGFSPILRNKVLEVRTVGVDKGATATNMLAVVEPDFILCMGDDATDEDMFRTLRDKGYTIKIGRGSTAAEPNRSH